MKLLIIGQKKSDLVKIAAIMQAINKYNKIQALIVYFQVNADVKFFKRFYKDLDLPLPKKIIKVKMDKIKFIGKSLLELEKIFRKYKPNLTILIGASESALAAALVSSKLKIPIAHIDSGLRSFDINTPDELNRIIIDHISDYLFTISQYDYINLKKEGFPDYKIIMIGSLAVDTLLNYQNITKEKVSKNSFLANKKFNNFAIVYLRNYFDKEYIASEKMLPAFLKISEKIPILLIGDSKIKGLIKSLRQERNSNIFFNALLPYSEFIYLLSQAKIILTDSNNIQDEATILGIPCLVLKEKTEKPIVVKEGTSILVGNNPSYIINTAFSLLNSDIPPHLIPPLWDGHASDRLMDILIKDMGLI